MKLFPRIQDAGKAAWAVLWGRTEQHRQMADMRREWAEVLIDVDTMFDKMNALVARLAKRQKRESEDQGVPEMVAPPMNPTYSERKADLRRRISLHRGRQPQNREQA